MSARRWASIAIAAAIVSGLGRSHAAAQGLTVAGGYSALQDLGAGATPAAMYARGWFVAATHPLGLWKFDVAFDLSRHARDQFGIQTSTLTGVLGGVRLPLVTIGRLRTFGQVVVGVERFAEPGFHERGTAVQPGAGVDVSLSRHLGARGQVDYRVSTMNGATFKEVRGVVGVVWSRR